MEKITNKQKFIIGITTILAAAISLTLFISQSNHKDRLDSGRVSIQKAPIIRTKASYPDAIPGKIITLKKLRRSYTFDYFKMFSDKVRKFLQFPEKITFGYVEHRVNYEVEEIKRGKRIVYSIWDNVANQFAGTLQIREKSESDPGQFGMWLNEKFWGGGRIQEAMLLISKAYFDAKPKTMNYIAFVRPWNRRSCRAMQKFGFKNIGESSYDNEIVHVYELTRNTIEKKLQK